MLISSIRDFALIPPFTPPYATSGWSATAPEFPLSTYPLPGRAVIYAGPPLNAKSSRVFRARCFDGPRKGSVLPLLKIDCIEVDHPGGDGVTDEENAVLYILQSFDLDF